MEQERDARLHEEDEYDPQDETQTTPEAEEEDYGADADEESYDYDDEETDGEEEEEYEDEEEGEEEDEDDEPNDTTYFMQLFDYLEKAMSSGTNVPLTTKKLVDVDECFKILDDMKRNLPDAIQYGWKIYEEKNRILEKAESMAQAKVTTANVKAKSILDEASERAASIGDNAQRRARATVADAEERAKATKRQADDYAARKVSESEIMQRARTEARDLMDKARSDAHERRLKAVQDAYRLLDALQKQTDGIAQALENKKNELVGQDRESGGRRAAVCVSGVPKGREKHFMYAKEKRV